MTTTWLSSFSQVVIFREVIYTAAELCNVLAAVWEEFFNQNYLECHPELEK